MSESTRILLLKRDFQLEYDQLKRKSSEQEIDVLYKCKFILFHKVYTLFLYCINDIDGLFELNETNLLINEFEPDIVEFYMLILNHLYFNEERLSKFMYKSKMFAIVRASGILSTTCTNAKTLHLTRTFVNIINTSLMRFKLLNSSLFASQLLENNDIDLMFSQIASSLAMCKLHWASSSTFLSLIYTYKYKLSRVTALTSSNDNLGMQNQIYRLFEHALKLNPKSLQLWLSFFKFTLETFGQNTNKILSMYYKSIRDVPFCKVNAVILLETTACLSYNFFSLKGTLHECHSMSASKIQRNNSNAI
jgi:hypothetical protein